MQQLPLILVVDDDDEIGMMLKVMLEHKEFSVIVCRRAAQIEEILKNNEVNLIILDMLIAGVKGTDVCTGLKNNKSFAHLPVMIITALPDAETLCRSAGADDFLAKPFEMDHMLLKINSLINTKQIGRSSI